MDSLQAELANCKPDEMREMAKRLSRSVDSMKQMMADLQAEQQELKAENEHLNSTIDLMMQELKKLNIGADNCVEPMLDEGPLDFMNRVWERVKPRENTYMVADNISEIRKVEPGEEGNELGRYAQKRAKEVGEQLQGALGPIWAHAEGFLSTAQEELAAQMTAQPSTSASSGRERGYSASFAGLAPGFDALLAKGQELMGRKATGSFDSRENAEPQPLPKDTRPGAVVEIPPAAQQRKTVEQKSEGGEEKAENNSKGPDTLNAKTAPEEQISSTVLIEASITLEDGSVQILQVRAADRCKEVAHRFIQEHSLKAWFEAPLTTWLKKVEADAVKFPVKIEGNLQEIRKTHSKSK
eukprot:TRINITY_DN59050_c0_g1_i1.p1 TRINITY_DN59050_c0_g1~~TRINITY_DN59050_c0_g1_i1.p1  ORF type:complete len:354 (-),score=96.20 TRINITY_DN59050_c0_g1_i1:270-1331(-)